MNINDRGRRWCETDGQANQTGELKHVDPEAEQITQMRVHAEILVKLLTSPAPTDFSWAMAVNDTIVRIVNIHNRITWTRTKGR